MTVKSIFIFFLCIYSIKSNAQPPTTGDRLIQVVDGKNLRMMQIDSITNLITLAINAKVRDGSTLISGDSIVVNERTQEAEIFGNVHINDADSIHTYAQYLKYIGGSRKAILKRNVRLTDGKGTLLANDVDYDLASGIATYKNGGKIIRGKTVLTSENGVYISATKDVFFKKNVHLVDDKNDIVADSLKFNINTSIANFIAPTVITSKEGGVIKTRNGTYNLNTGEAIFEDRTTMSNKDFSATGDRITYLEKEGLMQVDGNGIVVDSTNKVIVMGNSIVADRKKNSFLATRKPVMVIYKDGDSTYIAADTLFSGVNIYDRKSTTKDSVKIDSTKSINAINLNNKKGNDSIRYFIAYHHVRIFNDSLQAVSDSLHYSTFDSTFKLFQNPVVWNGNSQVTGDTMLLFTKNQKPGKLNVFYNAMVVNRDSSGIFNQIAGRTLVANFVEGNIDNIRVKGSPAESIYYPMDEDSSYTGMNRTESDVIDVIFQNKELYRIKLINKASGTLYPINQIPENRNRLRNFVWLDDRRPKNKLELFE